MSALRVFLFALAGALLGACHVGPQIDDSKIGRLPQGVNVLVELTRIVDGPRGEYQGELLEVREDGLVVLTPNDTQSAARIILIPWNRVYSAEATNLSGVKLRDNYSRERRKKSIETMRNTSRFPQGLSAELTSQLLAHYGQTALGTLDD
jgi:hypothetical protein